MQNACNLFGANVLKVFMYAILFMYGNSFIRKTFTGDPSIV